jgi:hypothetical protein
MTSKHLFTGAMTALLATVVAGTASASSHREAPAIADDPSADNTDVWAWVTPTTHANLNIVAAWVPLEEPSGGPNFHGFSDQVLYEIHIARGVASLDDAVTYQIKFTKSAFPKVAVDSKTAAPGGGKEFFYQLSGQTTTYTITKIVNGTATVMVKDAKVAPANIGPRTDKVAYAIAGANGTTSAYTDNYISSNFFSNLTNGANAEGRVFVGPRDDGFYVDLGGVFDLANLRAKGVAQDGVAGFNCQAISLQIPTTALTADGQAPTNGAGTTNFLGVWASSSRRAASLLRADGSTESFGPWVQVSRLGFPLINEAVVGLQDKDRYNRGKPKNDATTFGAYYTNPIIARDYEVVAGVTLPDGNKFGRTDVLDVLNAKDFPTAGAHTVPLTATGDVLRVDLGVDSAFPNGRSLPDTVTNVEGADVTDILLSYLITKSLTGVSDGVDHNDTNYPGTFPYLALPWRGFDQGHGKPTN